MASPIQQRLNKIHDEIRLKRITQGLCPRCGASDKNSLNGNTIIGKIDGRLANIVCLNNWHTRYPEKPTVIGESNHLESPLKPDAPHSSQ